LTSMKKMLLTTIIIMMTGGAITTLILFTRLPTGGTILLTPITGVLILIHGDGHRGTMVTTHPGIDPTITVTTPTTTHTGTIGGPIGAVHLNVVLLFDGTVTTKAVEVDSPAQELVQELL